jgi:uncharacterized protein with HEPN domain
LTRSEDELLRDALTHFERIAVYAEGDLEDQLVVDAICMRLSAGIEVLARLDQGTPDQLFGEAWRDMWGMRNRIAHGYLLVNAEIVQQTVHDDVPEIINAIEAVPEAPS